MRIIEEEILLDRWYILTYSNRWPHFKREPWFYYFYYWVPTTTDAVLCGTGGPVYSPVCISCPFVVVSCSNPRTVCCYVCECTALLHNWSDCYISKYMLLGETKKVKCLESFFVLLVVAISREQTPRESVEPGTV